MGDFLCVVTLLSAIIAGWAFVRAYRIHRRIEANYPGLNDFMRGCKRTRPDKSYRP